MSLHDCRPPAECFYCPKCKTTVEHQEIPEDTAHCFCRRNRVDNCACPCHIEILIPA